MLCNGVVRHHVGSRITHMTSVNYPFNETLITAYYLPINPLAGLLLLITNSKKRKPFDLIFTGAAVNQSITCMFHMVVSLMSKTVCTIDFMQRLNNLLHFNNVPVVSGLFTAIKRMEKDYIMLCILESGSSELIIRGI